MKLLLCFLLSLSAQAAFKTEGEFVLPISRKDYPLTQLIQDYAEFMNLSVTYKKSVFPEGRKVHLELNQKLNKEELRKIVYAVLSAEGYTVSDEQGFLWIMNSRDIRYASRPLATTESFNKDSSFGLVLIQLKYPLSTAITRNLRPMLSRYGRVIDFSDGKSLIVSDEGTSIDRIIKVVRLMDTKEAFERLLNDVPKPKEEDPKMLERIVELEQEKKILEKKYQELKGQGDHGVVHGGMQ